MIPQRDLIAHIRNIQFTLLVTTGSFVALSQLNPPRNIADTLDETIRLISLRDDYRTNWSRPHLNELAVQPRFIEILVIPREIPNATRSPAPFLYSHNAFPTLELVSIRESRPPLGLELPTSPSLREFSDYWDFLFELKSFTLHPENAKSARIRSTDGRYSFECTLVPFPYLREVHDALFFTRFRVLAADVLAAWLSNVIDTRSFGCSGRGSSTTVWIMTST